MPVPVTVIDHDPRELGAMAARLLFDRLGDRNPGGSGPRVVTIPISVERVRG
ncbi:hypothetical protein P9139_06005 [Curtobacterium flaccumfaciens]|nr:hypothetical protein P9139_06005 [Curtobacterium flaccumfaciens]